MIPPQEVNTHMIALLKAPAERVSGKQGNQLVWMGWRTNQCAREYVVPSNPSSPNQVLVRNILASLSAAWPSLSDAERNSWATYASNNLVTNRLGQQVRSTALGCYIQLNSINWMRAGSGAVIDTAPSTTAPAPPTGIVGVLENGSSTDIIISINHGIAVVANLFVMARLMPITSLAQNAQYQAIPLVSGAGSESFSALAAGPTANQEFANTRSEYVATDFARVAVQIVNANGQASVPFVATVTVTEP